MRLLLGTPFIAMLLSGHAAAQDHQHHASPPKPPAQAPATPDPHAGHRMPSPSPAADPHAGHDMSSMASQEAGRGSPDVATSADDVGRPLQPVPPPAALSGPTHAADAVWGSDRMSGARYALRRENGDVRTTAVLIDRIEAGFGDGSDGWSWEAGGWTGGDINRLWWKSEGEGDFDGEIEGEVQGLFSRAVLPFWDIQAGIRQDFREGDQDPTHFVLGVQGLAPHWWHVDAAAFLSGDGDLTARVEVEYDQRITRSLILQPRFEVEASAADIPALGLGSGLTAIHAGLRLRYEIAREFAPYVGVEWSREFGDTADLTRALGGKPELARIVVGLRAWY